MNRLSKYLFVVKEKIIWSWCQKSVTFATPKSKSNLFAISKFSTTKKELKRMAWRASYCPVTGQTWTSFQSMLPRGRRLPWRFWSSEFLTVLDSLVNPFDLFLLTFSQISSRWQTKLNFGVKNNTHRSTSGRSPGVPLNLVSMIVWPFSNRKHPDHGWHAWYVLLSQKKIIQYKLLISVEPSFENCDAFSWRNQYVFARKLRRNWKHICWFLWLPKAYCWHAPREVWQLISWTGLILTFDT